MNVPGVEYRSPKRFTLRERLTLVIVPRVCGWSIRAIGLTLRSEIRHLDRFERALQRNGHVIIAFWHETIAMAIWRYRGTGYHTMTSYSYDGELAAQAVRQFGLRAVRGSTSEGGGGALRELEKAIAQVEGVGITPDGPRGPRRVAQPGAAILAARTQTPIIPHAVAVSPAWRLRSWDRFMVPKLFARVVHVYGEPIDPPASESPEDVEAIRAEMDRALNALHRDLEAELGLQVFDT